MAAYEVLLLNTAVPQIQAAQAGDTYVVPRDIAVTAALSVTGNTTLGDAATDTVQVNGYMGVGGAPNSSIAIFANPSALTGVSQTGVYSLPVSTSAATTVTRSFLSLPSTAAAAYTSTDVVGYWAANATLGAGSTITNQHGLYVADQTRATNNYGITSLVSSGTDKWNIYASGTAANYFAGSVGIGTTSPTYKLDVNSGTDNFPARFTSTDAGSWIQFNDNDALGYYLGTVTSAFVIRDTNNAERLRIDSAGNVGIGTSSPATNLVVSASVNPIFRLNNSTNTINTGEDIGEIQFYTNDTSTSGTGVKAFIKTVAGAFGSAQGAASLAFGTTNNAEGNATERLRIDRAGNVSIGGTANRATTVGTQALNIFDGTAPVGTLANGVSFYSASGEANVMDAAGNATLLSPHDSETNEWIFRSKHTPTGKVLRIDVERLLRFVNDHFGLDAVKEFVEE